MVWRSLSIRMGWNVFLPIPVMLPLFVYFLGYSYNIGIPLPPKKVQKSKKISIGFHNMELWNPIENVDYLVDYLLCLAEFCVPPYFEAVFLLPYISV